MARRPDRRSPPSGPTPVDPPWVDDERPSRDPPPPIEPDWAQADEPPVEPLEPYEPAWAQEAPKPVPAPRDPPWAEEPDEDADALRAALEEKEPPEKIVKRNTTSGKTKKEASQITNLKQELKSAKEYLQATIEELETSNEELKSTNEEMQSTNEELQSTNEELETSKEEQQSTNEELETVNSELQNKVNELSRSNNDLNNLLGSTQIATIFLDTKLRIVRFTPALTKLFNVLPSDLNRHIGDITSKFNCETLFQDAEAVLNTLIQRESEICTQDDKYFNMSVLPYRTTENMIDGVVITFVDITTIRQAEIALKETTEKYRSIFNEARDGIVIIDKKTGIIADCNQAFEGQTGRPLEHLKRLKIWEIRPSRKKERARNEFVELNEIGVDGSSRLDIEKPNGDIISLEFSSRVVTIGNQPYIQSIARDIPGGKRQKKR